MILMRTKNYLFIFRLSSFHIDLSRGSSNPYFASFIETGVSDWCISKSGSDGFKIVTNIHDLHHWLYTKRAKLIWILKAAFLRERKSSFMSTIYWFFSILSWYRGGLYWGRYHQELSSQLITLKSQISPVKNSNLQSSGLVCLVAKSSVFKTRQF